MSEALHQLRLLFVSGCVTPISQVSYLFDLLEQCNRYARWETARCQSISSRRGHIQRCSRPIYRPVSVILRNWPCSRLSTHFPLIARYALLVNIFVYFSGQHVKPLVAGVVKVGQSFSFDLAKNSGHSVFCT